MKTFTLIVAISMMLAAPLHALPPQPPDDADGWARAVAPFIDDLTFAVIRVNLDKIDPGQVVQYVRERIAKGGGLPEIEPVLKTAQDWGQALKKAGLRDLYVIISMADTPEPTFSIAPLYQGADGQRIADLYSCGPQDSAKVANPPPASQPSMDRPGRSGAAVLSEYVFFGPPEALQRIRSMQPSARPALAAAFRAAGDSAVQVVLAPSDDFRRVIEETIPSLPPHLGGGSSAVLTRGVRWAALGLDTPPSMSLRLAVQSADRQAAQALAGQIDKVFAMLTGPAQTTSMPNDAPPPAQLPAQFRAELREAFPHLDEVLAMLKPRQVEDQLVLALSVEDTTKIVERLVTPSLGKARQHAKQVASLSQVGGLAKAANLYAADHSGQWPNDFNALVQAGLISEKMLVNITNPQLKPGYIYLKPAAPANKIEQAARTILIYAAYEQWPADGIPVGFADGHREIIADQATFEKLLADSKAPQKP